MIKNGHPLDNHDYLSTRNAYFSDNFSHNPIQIIQMFARVQGAELPVTLCALLVQPVWGVVRGLNSNNSKLLLSSLSSTSPPSNNSPKRDTLHEYRFQSKSTSDHPTQPEQQQYTAVGIKQVIECVCLWCVVPVHWQQVARNAAETGCNCIELDLFKGATLHRVHHVVGA